MRPRDLAVSVLLHAAFVLLLLQAYKGWKSGGLQQALGFAIDVGPGVVAVNIPPPPPAAPVRAPRPREVRQQGAPTVLTVPSPTIPEPAAPPAEPGGVDGGIPGGMPGGILGIGPLTGDSRLWVRPMFLPEGGGRPLQMDSVVRGRLLAMAVMADSIRRLDSMGINTNPYAPSSWTFTRNGETYGMDSRWFYLGPIRIPTAILAFVPMPNLGNYDQARQNQRLAEMRGEILRAAARSEAEDDFRRAVQQIRERRDRERREERQRLQQQRDQQHPDDQDRPLN